MTADPYLAATEDYAARMAAQVQAGADPSIAWALLIADALGVAADPAVPPATRDASTSRSPGRRATPPHRHDRAGGHAWPAVPDDASDLDGEPLA